MTRSVLASIRPLAAAAALALAGAAASAATVDFSGTTDSGPLTGAVFSGSFSFADPAPGASTAVALDSFTLLFDGFTYTLGDADFTPTALFDAGTFLGIDYVASTGSSWQISLLAGFTSVNEALFSYIDAASGAQGFGTPVFTAAVPEPGSLALMAGALGLLAATRRRAAA